MAVGYFTDTGTWGGGAHYNIGAGWPAPSMAATELGMQFSEKEKERIDQAAREIDAAIRLGKHRDKDAWQAEVDAIEARNLAVFGDRKGAAFALVSIQSNMARARRGMNNNRFDSSLIPAIISAYESGGVRAVAEVIRTGAQVSSASMGSSGSGSGSGSSYSNSGYTPPSHFTKNISYKYDEPSGYGRCYEPITEKRSSDIETYGEFYLDHRKYESSNPAAPSGFSDHSSGVASAATSAANRLADEGAKQSSHLAALKKAEEDGTLDARDHALMRSLEEKSQGIKSQIQAGKAQKSSSRFESLPKSRPLALAALPPTHSHAKAAEAIPAKAAEAIPAKAAEAIPAKAAEAIPAKAAEAIPAKAAEAIPAKAAEAIPAKAAEAIPATTPEDSTKAQGPSEAKKSGVKPTTTDQTPKNNKIAVFMGM